MSRRVGMAPELGAEYGNASRAWERFIAARAMSDAEIQLRQAQERFDAAKRVFDGLPEPAEPEGSLTDVLIDIARAGGA